MLQAHGNGGLLQIKNESDGNTETIEVGNSFRFFAWHRYEDGIYFTDSAHLYYVSSSPGTSPRKVAGPFQSILDFQLSPDGKQAALATIDTYTPIVDLQTGTVVRELPIPLISSNLAVAWSPDGKSLATGGRDQVTEIWDTATWERANKLLGHSYEITDIAWNPRLPRLATASRDKTIRVLETKTFQTTIVLTMNNEVGKVSWSPDGLRLVGVDIRGAIKIWDATPSYTLADDNP
ncbi:WD40 repeat domain-containing protein [Planctomycetaceae bacterium SH139]